MHLWNAAWYWGGAPSKYRGWSAHGASQDLYTNDGCAPCIFAYLQAQMPLSAPPNAWTCSPPKAKIYKGENTCPCANLCASMSDQECGGAQGHLEGCLQVLYDFWCTVVISGAGDNLHAYILQ